MKTKFEDYTEAEFFELVKKIWEVNVSSEKEHDELVEHFVSITEHPATTDVIFYPAPEVEDSPQGILSVVKAWRIANGKPGFKSA